MIPARKIASPGLHLLHSLVMVCLAIGATNANGAAKFRVVKRMSLPSGVIARDVRWAGASEAYVSAGRQGVVRTELFSSGAPEPLVPVADGNGSFLSSSIALGQNHFLLASPMGVIGWLPLTGTERKIGTISFAAIMDIDARGDQAAILGAARGGVQGLDPHGSIAWLGSLSRGMKDLRPLMTGRSRPGGKDMARCAILETGSVRFMRDGTLIVVPGSEPGIYRYGPNGKLLQTWDTDRLGLMDDCNLSDSEMQRLAADFARRITWYASRIILEEILPMPAGAALILRRVESGVTKWDFVTLNWAEKKTETVPLPVSLPNVRGRVRGDVRGNTILLLVFEDPLPGRKPLAPPELVVLTVE